MTTDQKDEAAAKTSTAIIEKRENNVLFAVVVLGCAIIAPLALYALFASGALIDITNKAQEAAAQEVRATPFPFPVRTTLARCAETRGGERYLIQAGLYPPSVREAFFGIDPDVATNAIAAVADAMLSECAERFVLDGGTVDDMLFRAELLGDYLTDEFRGESLALALNNRADD
jgi:hypothetical protein